MTIATLEEKIEVVKSLDDYFAGQNEQMIRNPDTTWQPSEYSKFLRSHNVHQEIDRRKSMSASLTDALVVVLVGNYIVEEALPNYMSWQNRMSYGDKSGVDQHSLAVWIRNWTGEEGRHARIFRLYLELVDGVDLESVDRTIHHYYANGFNPNFGPIDPKLGADPYKSFLYTAWQEKVTRIIHGGVQRLAFKQGDEYLGTVSGLVSGDEKRHERYYAKGVDKFIQIDPDTIVVDAYDLFSKILGMPGELMRDNSKMSIARGRTKIFMDHINANAATGIFTKEHNADVLTGLIDYWGILTIPSLGPEAREAQDKLGETLKGMNKEDRLRGTIHVPWIYNRPIDLAKAGLRLDYNPN